MIPFSDYVLQGMKSKDKVNSDVEIGNRITKATFTCSTAILVVLFLLVTADSHVRDPVICIFNKTNEPLAHVMNTYCYVTATTTIRGSPFAEEKKDEDLRHHAYYKWVPYALAILVVAFYMPKYLWTYKENKYLAYLIMGLNGETVNRHDVNNRLEMLADQLSRRMGLHNMLGLFSLVKDVAGFAVTVMAISFLNYLTEGSFLNYGVKVIEYWRHKSVLSPMSVIFPRVAKCQMTNIGYSGSTRVEDALCVLSRNMLYDKMFLVLWLWLLPMALLCLFSLLFSTLCLLSRSFRFMAFKVLLRSAANPMVPVLKHIAHVYQFGDWFIMFQLAKNMKREYFTRLCTEKLRLKWSVQKND